MSFYMTHMYPIPPTAHLIDLEILSINTDDDWKQQICNLQQNLQITGFLLSLCFPS